MSYAAAAASGPAQSAEEVVQSTDTSTESLVDVDSIHVSTVPSDFESQEIKTDTQATRLQHEAEDRDRIQELEAKKRGIKDKMQAKAAKAEKKAKANSGNPVMLGNAIAVAGLSAALGFGAYRKYAAGELTWKVVGIWGGVVGLFATGDYYLSQYDILCPPRIHLPLNRTGADSRRKDICSERSTPRNS
ncbi:hypothetical protein FGG08_007168 [Glutinoglossum americanum]|uniref:Mitochondrial outer membrane protein OM14 C-terminal domain-containing protein n=1 Tax=Glutinoglossum americanum TaxID=1670608 RepID=A0A9P8L0B4_9PEZI|nr:hypothetical protein FGG08_007168 [Glutinoglossum americanum]